jgi:hypothetical protein
MQGFRRLTAALLTSGALLAQAPNPYQVPVPSVPNPLDTVLKIQQIREAQERARLLEEQTRQLNEQRANSQRQREAEKQRAAFAASPNLTMKELMGDDGFKLTGLDLLKPEQLVFLDSWVSLYSERLAKLFSSPPLEAIESEIKGDFHGWSGDTIFELENGQIWKQSSYDYEYEYDYNPKVVIYPIGSVFKMKVDGVKGAVEVRRIK